MFVLPSEGALRLSASFLCLNTSINNILTNIRKDLFVYRTISYTLPQSKIEVKGLLYQFLLSCLAAQSVSVHLRVTLYSAELIT